MNIPEYIQSFTNINKDNKTNKIKLSNTPLPNKILEVGNSYSYNLPCWSDLKHSTKIKLGDLGLNDFSCLKKGFKEFQQKYMIVSAQKNSNKSDTSYTTTSSATGDSYFTAVEDFEHSKRSNNDLNSEISFDSGMDEGKRELITRLLQSEASDYFDEEEFFPNSPAISYETQDLLDDIEIEQKNWDDDINDQLMYKDRIYRFFRSMTEDLNHPFKEDFNKAPEWQRPDVVQKVIPVSENTRQYFMNLTDKHFSEFERKKSSESISLGEDYTASFQRNFSSILSNFNIKENRS